MLPSRAINPAPDRSDDMLADQKNAPAAARRLPNRKAALDALYNDISAKSMFPFWATSTDVAHDEIKQLMGTQKAVPHLLELQGRHRADSVPRGRAGHHGRFRAPLADPGQSRAVAAARHREHDVHRLSAQRRQRGDAAAPALAQRDPLRLDRQGQFHRRRRRGHHLRAGRHGAHPGRHLAQPRQCRQRAGGQSLGARPAAGRDPQRGLFRARLYRDGRRQAGQEEAADRDRAVRLLRPRLRPRRPQAALPPASPRRRVLLADVRLPLGARCRN